MLRILSIRIDNREYTYDLDGKGKPFAWNSKSWRQMVYGSIKDNMFIFSREYPQHYQNDAITTEVRTMLEHTIAEFCRRTYNSDFQERILHHAEHDKSANRVLLHWQS